MLEKTNFTLQNIQEALTFLKAEARKRNKQLYLLRNYDVIWVSDISDFLIKDGKIYSSVAKAHPKARHCYCSVNKKNNMQKPTYNLYNWELVRPNQLSGFTDNPRFPGREIETSSIIGFDRNKRLIETFNTNYVLIEIEEYNEEFVFEYLEKYLQEEKNGLK